MLTITSNPNNILKVESYLKMLDFDLQFDEDKYADILISLTEAVNNAIIHGNKRDESKKVHIYVQSNEDGITFKVEDEGAGFNPTKVPDPTCPENIDCCGGRGVYIMKALADDISFYDNGRSVEMFFSLKASIVKTNE
ncbi:MAG: ATP-binding protein [Saprospiraceae bacterium]|nr:ATP-binding protein [Saprospiraceae bacterium]MCZ2338813.1 ATP-binding protein [Chitinophagales bacterium]